MTGAVAPCAASASLALVALVASVSSSSPVQAAGTRVDGVAAVVGERGADPALVLRSDVELWARIAMSGRLGRPALGPLPAGLLDSSLQEMIGEHLIAREARRVEAARPSAADRADEQRRLATLAGGEANLRALFEALGASDAELEAMVERRALVAAFLSANLEGATVVTESELNRAYEAQRERFEGKDRSAVMQTLRGELAREVLHRTIERWVTVLGARTSVLVYAHYGGER